MTRRLMAVVLAVLALGMFGCGPPWKIVRQAAPNPLLGQKNFAVAPVNFEGLMVGDGSEAEYMADKDAEEKNNWVQTKVEMNEVFRAALMAEGAEDGLQIVGPPAKAPFIIQPKITWLEPGLFTAISFATWGSEVKMTLVITKEDGTVVDEILLEHGTDSTMFTPAKKQRLKSDATGLGGLTARYVGTRSVGEN